MRFGWSRQDWGYFYAIGPIGTHYGLIGHDSADVTKWLEAHPGFDGEILFDYGNDEPQVDVTEIFLGNDEEDDEAQDGRVAA